jgi:galactokinase
VTTSWQAPSRVNLIGEHVDYNDGLVLPFALPMATTATVTRRDRTTVEVTSDSLGTETFGIFTRPGDVTSWASYVAGVVWALRDHGLDVPGLDISLTSDIPVGAGLSSSAAVCCSVASAIVEEIGESMSARQIAEIARRAENAYVGANTGVMDQLASMLSIEGHALLIDCRTIETRPIPFDLAAHGLTLLLIDTNARHTLVTSEYGDRRHECEQAAAWIGMPSLRDASEELVAAISDPVLQRRAQHVVTEIGRVEDVVRLLDADNPDAIGGFLTASHISLRDDFEVSCVELDVTVDAALDGGALGARMTGGGFGGCAIALVRLGDVGRVVDSVDDAFEQRDWKPASTWIAIPSPGAHPLP